MSSVGTRWTGRTEQMFVHVGVRTHCIRLSADGLTDFSLLEVADWWKLRERRKKEVIVCLLTGEEQKKKMKLQRFWTRNTCTKGAMNGGFRPLWQAKISECFRTTCWDFWLSWICWDQIGEVRTHHLWRRFTYDFIFQYRTAGRKNILTLDRVNVRCHTSTWVGNNFVRLLRPLLPTVRLS